MFDVVLWVILVAGGVLLLMVIGVVVLRSSRRDSGVFPPMPAAYRAGEAGTWRTGVLRCADDRLVLRGPGGLAEGPFARGMLDLGVAGPLPEDEARQIGRGPLVQVPVSYGSTRFELALDERRYTALRAWVEAVPPGWNTQVA